MSNPDHEIALRLVSLVAKAHVKQLCEEGLTIAELGGGINQMHALAKEGGPGRSLVVLLCGPIPDDLIQSLGHYCEGLSQDLKTSGVLKEI